MVTVTTEVEIEEKKTADDPVFWVGGNSGDIYVKFSEGFVRIHNEEGSAGNVGGFHPQSIRQGSFTPLNGTLTITQKVG